MYSKLFEKKVLLLIILSFGIFVAKNFLRINHEINKYGYEPLKNPYYHITKNAFYFKKRIFQINKAANKKDKKYYLILNDDLINLKN